MNNKLYLKLAFSNLRRNYKTGMPYFFTCICTIMMFYIMLTLSKDKGIFELQGSTEIQTILFLGSIVIGIFSAVFLFYTNSFLIKQRKKEIGLYQILGMERKHIAKVLFFETLFLSFGSILIGIAGGIAFSKLIYLLLLKMLGFSVPLTFSVSFFSIRVTILIFVIIFSVILLSNLLQIRLSHPISLLKGGNIGEKEPKSNFLLTAIGIFSLGIGYSIAIFVKSPLQALTWFFIAVVLVMIGTYALFTSGSVVLLKALRKNKKFYYQTKHFVSVSSMIYRMKQNAIGLANICILSCAVLVMLSTTFSLYNWKDDVLKTRFPMDTAIYMKQNPETIQQAAQMIESIAKNYSVSVEDFISYQYQEVLMTQNGNQFFPFEEESTLEWANVKFLLEEEYNRLTNQSVSLKENEILLFSENKNFKQEHIFLNEKEFFVRQNLSSFPDAKQKDVTVTNQCTIVVSGKENIPLPDEDALSYKRPSACIKFNLAGTKSEIFAYVSDLNKQLRNQFTDFYFENIYLMEESFYVLYGGLLFIGLFLGTLFFLATALIIYYKQISEGYDDRERYEILQKVGMSHTEIKKTINSQILIVFFLPLISAVIHVCFAFPVITKLLAVLNFENVPLFLLSAFGTIAAFSIVYGCVYAITARIYYKIVQ